MPNSKYIVRTLVALLVVFVLVVGGCSSTYVNTEYQKSVVTRFGKTHDVTGPGFHFKLPFADTVNTADTRVSKLAYSDLVVATRDGQIITVDLTLNHQIAESDSNLRSLYEMFGGQFDYDSRLLRDLAIDRAKSVMGEYQMEDFMKSRSQIRTESLKAVQDAVRPYGINIVDIQISNFTFSEKYKERLEDINAQRAKATAAEQKLREEQSLSKQKVERAKGEAESLRELADANAYKRKLEAETNAHARDIQSVADAAAIEREGEAQAKAMRVQAMALKGSPELVAYERAQAQKQWNGSSMPKIMINGSNGGAGLFPFLNVNDALKD